MSALKTNASEEEKNIENPADGNHDAGSNGCAKGQTAEKEWLVVKVRRGRATDRRCRTKRFPHMPIVAWNKAGTQWTGAEWRKSFEPELQKALGTASAETTVSTRAFSQVNATLRKQGLVPGSPSFIYRPCR